MADNCYLGVWLNGMEELLARWYLKECIPCFVVREVMFPEHARLAALETMIDFAAGTDASALDWSINKYSTMAEGTCKCQTLPSSTTWAGYGQTLWTSFEVQQWKSWRSPRRSTTNPLHWTPSLSPQTGYYGSDRHL